MDKSKLYDLTAESFVFPFYVDQKRNVHTLPANDIPMLKWPDGSWCFLANIYMIELFRRGLSRKNKGGTLLAYATNITHLIRFCFFNRVDFIDLTDSQFTFFIKSLQGQRRQKTPEVATRDANSVISIGRNCLDFLNVVAQVYNDEWFIGAKGRIRAVKKEADVRLGGSNKVIKRKFWYHHSFPTPDEKRQRLPISTADLKRLQEAILDASTSIFQRKRRYVTLKLLEITGGRRSEVASITVESVRSAAKLSQPVLKIPTAKRRKGGSQFRYVPIARHDIDFLLEFIDKNRRGVIRRTCGHDKDCGFLLISETTGQQLKPNTITQEIHILAKTAGILNKVCPHMFRHRFITKLFVALIEQHNIENTDEFRKLLLDGETFKQKVQEFTGHKDLRSLDIYIHLAFEEITNFSKTYNLALVDRAIESFRGTLSYLKGELGGGLSVSEATQQLSKLIDALESDLCNARNGTT